MAGKTAGMNNVGDKKDSEKKRTRQRSTIEFPYHDQDNAIKVVKAIHDNAGTRCTVDQLAAYLNQSSTSGAFRVRLSSARIFDLIITERGGETRITALGKNILNPELEEQARADSFLSVALFCAIYEKYKGHMLPPAKALEREFEDLGVTFKSKNVARQVFERSAKQAGFFAHGDDKLIKPANKDSKFESAPVQTKQYAESTSHSDGDNDGFELHPLIQGLIKVLPDPNTEWPLDARVRWLQAATNIFALIYPGSNDSKINIADNGNLSVDERQW